MGENGAGKSTLIKALTGALPLDAGVDPARRRAVRLPSPARRAAPRHPHRLPGDRPAAEPVGRREHRARSRAAPVRRHRLASGCDATPRAVLADLGLDIDPASPLGSHSLAVQQLVAIARAISTDVRVLVLDEPTSSLDADEVAELFRVIRELKERGVAILFVSHFLDQVYEICDRMTVLRDGATRRRVPHARAAAHRPRAEDARPRSEHRGTRAALRGSRELDARRSSTARDVTVGPGLRGADCRAARGRGARSRRPPRLGPHRTRPRAHRRRPAGRRRHPDRESGRTLPHNPRRAIALGVVYSSENRRSRGHHRRS